ncbi:uncharacterized protein LOC142349957 [Convolutriloba macropyga]|uniref:uncharacterized protein LOC142349957 n=1 Tax=Convolutriloba macropyga TaxID=536237 RepID=UPI003F51C7D8
MAQNVSTCSVCGVEEIELYFCETCSVSETESSQQKQLLCEPCLGPHVRQGHQVTTSKGQEPLICSKHRRLHNQYCKSCDESFCPKCLGNHSGHFMGSIDERAAEIRKEVFSMLTTLERNEKPLRAKKEEICALKMKHQFDQEKLKKFVENEIKKLRQLLLSRIAKNEAEMDSQEKAVSQEIDQVLELQNESRMLLSATSPHLVNKYKEVKLLFDQACKRFEETVLTQFQVKSSSALVLKDIIDEVGRTIDEKLKSDFTKKLEVAEHALLNGKHGKKYSLIVENEEANIFSVETRRDQKPWLEKLGKVSLNGVGPIKFFYSVFSELTKCSCVLLTYACTAYRIDVTEQNKVDLNEIKFPTFPNIVCPYTLPSTSKEVHWSYWSDEQKSLKFSHKPLFESKCLSQPSFVSLDTNGSELCFLVEGGNVLVVNPVKTKIETLLSTDHGIKDISHAILDRQGLLYLWSKQSEVCKLFYDSGDGWRLNCTDSWSNQNTKFRIFKNLGNNFGQEYFPSLRLDYNGKSYLYDCVVLYAS